MCLEYPVSSGIGTYILTFYPWVVTKTIRTVCNILEKPDQQLNRGFLCLLLRVLLLSLNMIFSSSIGWPVWLWCRVCRVWLGREVGMWFTRSLGVGVISLFKTVKLWKTQNLVPNLILSVCIHSLYDLISRF